MILYDTVFYTLKCFNRKKKINHYRYTLWFMQSKANRNLSRIKYKSIFLCLLLINTNTKPKQSSLSIQFSLFKQNSSFVLLDRIETRKENKDLYFALILRTTQHAGDRDEIFDTVKFKQARKNTQNTQNANKRGATTCG